mmetsp:Transcript_27227/g.68663  ORF Transcript_27227/g.68663 Transcript_27227/m.68663 type:complete len:269 (-) Transcript_27227:1070-1876(-)
MRTRRTILSLRSAGVFALLWGAAVAVDHNHASVLVASAKQEVLQPDSDVLKGAVDEKAVAMANQAAVVYDSDGIAAEESRSSVVSAGSATGQAHAGTRPPTLGPDLPATATPLSAVLQQSSSSKAAQKDKYKVRMLRTEKPKLPPTTGEATATAATGDASGETEQAAGVSDVQIGQAAKPGMSYRDKLLRHKYRKCQRGSCPRAVCVACYSLGFVRDFVCQSTLDLRGSAFSFRCHSRSVVCPVFSFPTFPPSCSHIDLRVGRWLIMH